MKYSLFFVFVFACLSSFSQEKISFQYSVINTSSGLNTNNVNDCVRDNRGFLWVATDLGVTRYADQNSVHFLKVPASGKSLANRAKMLIKDSLLYVCGRPGLYKINTNDLSISSVNEVPELTYDDMVFYKDDIILASRNRGLVLYNTVTQKVSEIDTEYAFIFSLKIKKNLLFCISLDKGCLIVDLNVKKLINSTRLSPFYFTDRLFLDKNGDMLYLSRDHIKAYDESKGKFSIIPGSPKNITAYAESGDDSKLYVIDFNLLNYADSSGKVYTIKPPVDRNTELKNIKKGTDGDMYIISNQGLILMRRIIPFTLLNVFNDNRSHVRRTIIEDMRRDRMLFFSYDKISVYDKKKGTYFVKSLPFYTHAVIHKGDSLILATEGSTVYSIQLSNFRYRLLFIKEYRPLQFISFDQSPNGTNLLGSMDGLFQTKDFTKGIEPVPLKFGKKDFTGSIVKAIWAKEKNRIWIGGSFGVLVMDSTLRIIDQFSTEAMGDHKLHLDEVNCLYGTKEGMFAGMDGDLVFIPNGGRPLQFLYSENFGKSTNRIIGVLEDNYGDIWFSSYQGIYRLDRKTKTIKAFHAPLYFNNDEFNRSSAWKGSDGKLYFGSIAEHVEIDPTLYRDIVSAPSLKINAVKIFGLDKTDQTRYNIQSGDTIYLPNEAGSIDMSFTLNDPFNIDKFQYQYRMLNTGAEWINLNARSSLQLFSLPAGKYQLQLKANGYDGKSSEVQSFVILVPTVFYKSPLFIFISAIIFILIGGAVYWSRVNNLKQKLRFRKELSNDLHDSVGTAVTKSIYAAQSIMDESDQQDNRLHQIIEYGKQIQNNFRDVLWSLETRTDEILNLFDRLSEIGNKAVENTQFDFVIQKNKIDERFQLTNRQKREILLISRECIHNALKHSNGHLILFDFSLVNSKLKLIISDDGYNENSNVHMNGIGIPSIMMRVKKMGGKVNFKKGENGFEVTLML